MEPASGLNGLLRTVWDTVETMVATSHRRCWSVWAAAVLLVTYVGCDGSDPPPSTQPTRQPTAEPTQGDAAQELPLGSSIALDPGRYTFSDFEPSVTFEVPGGWETGHQNEDFFDVWHSSPGEEPPVEAAVAWARPAFIVGNDGRVATDDLSPREAVETLASNPYVTAGRISDVTLDGYEGSSVSFEARRGGELFGGADGAFGSDNAHFRVAALEVEGALVLVLEISLRGPHDVHLQLTDGVWRTSTLAP